MTLSSLIASRVQVDMGQASSTAPDFIKNKPTLGTAAAQDSNAFDAAGAATSAQSAAASDATTKVNAAQAAAIQRANHTGTQSADTLTDGTTNKAYSATEKTKLAGIAASATANPADTGWTANSTAGDKTVAVAAYTNGISGTMVTALNVTSGGLGTALSALADQLAAVTKKLAAIETANAAGKFANA